MGGHGRKTINHSTRRAVLKKKGVREGDSGVARSRRASTREIQLPLNKLIHCRRPLQPVQSRSYPLFLLLGATLDTFSLSFSPFTDFFCSLFYSP